MDLTYDNSLLMTVSEICLVSAVVAMIPFLMKLMRNRSVNSGRRPKLRSIL